MIFSFFKEKVRTPKGKIKNRKLKKKKGAPSKNKVLCAELSMLLEKNAKGKTRNERQGYRGKRKVVTREIKTARLCVL